MEKEKKRVCYLHQTTFIRDGTPFNVLIHNICLRCFAKLNLLAKINTVIDTSDGKIILWKVNNKLYKKIETEVLKEIYEKDKNGKFTKTIFVL